MENKNGGSENNIILGDFSCIMDKMEMDGRNETLYRCWFNYVLSKLISDNWLDDTWRRENPDYPEFNSYGRSSGTRYRIDRIYTEIKLQAIPRLIT